MNTEGKEKRTKDGNSRENQHVDNLLKMKQRTQRNKFGELEKNYVEVCSIYKQKLDQWSRIESPEIYPYTYGHLIYDKGGRNTVEKRQSFTVTSISGAGKTGPLYCKRMKLEHSLTPYTKISSQ